MPKKQYNIRWRESDLAELQRVITNFNAKIYRIRKKDPKAEEYLPKIAKKSDVIATITTRADYDRLLNSYRRFAKRGAEKPVKSSRGAKFTEWEEREFKRKQGIVNAKRTRERNAVEDKELKSRGKGTGFKRKEMGTVRENELKPSRKNPRNMSKNEFQMAMRAIDRELNNADTLQRKLRMRQNYVKGMVDNGFSDDVINAVLQMQIDDFVDIVRTDREASFDFIYDPIELSFKENVLRDIWVK